ncbi:MAG: glycosyltransferase family 9 protein [Bacteroidota bacterium]
MPKFLILRFSSIGDIVLTTPVIRCLKQQVADAEVHYATKKSYKTLVENNPYVDQYFLLDKSDNELINQLKKEKYDYVIDLHHNIRTLKIKWKLGVKSYSFDKLNFKKWLLVNFTFPKFIGHYFSFVNSVGKINQMPPVHIVDRYLKTVESFGVVNDNIGLDYFIPDKDEFKIGGMGKVNFENYAVYAIGGQHETKKLPINKMVELCKTIQIPIVLIGGPEDFEKGEELILTLRNSFWPGALINMCGKCNLNQSASIIQKAAIVYTHDTGMMHVAAALKKKVISIWGNTVPAFGMYPYQTDYELIENNNLNCRPCSKIGFDQCPKDHFNCMNSLEFKV